MSLIYIKHPDKECNQNQEEFLLQFNEKEQLGHALLFNFGNATYRYHSIEPTKEDYEQWLEGLPQNVRIEFKLMGFEKCKTALPLRRFANEMRDRGMDEYIKSMLKPEDYEAIKEVETKQYLADSQENSEL